MICLREESDFNYQDSFNSIWELVIGTGSYVVPFVRIFCSKEKAWGKDSKDMNSKAKHNQMKGPAVSITEDYCSDCIN